MVWRRVSRLGALPHNRFGSKMERIVKVVMKIEGKTLVVFDDGREAYLTDDELQRCTMAVNKQEEVKRKKRGRPPKVKDGEQLSNRD
jgi:hypothetical protein